MEVYTWIKFIHVLGAMAFFAFVLSAQLQLRTADRERFGPTLAKAERIASLIAPTSLLMLVTGLYLAVAAWGFATAWIAPSPSRKTSADAWKPSRRALRRAARRPAAGRDGPATPDADRTRQKA